MRDMNKEWLAWQRHNSSSVVLVLRIHGHGFFLLSFVLSMPKKERSIVPRQLSIDHLNIGAERGVGRGEAQVVAVLAAAMV